MASAAAGHEENDKGIVVEERLQAYKRINAALIKLTTNMVKAQRAAMTAERQLAEGIKAVATEEANKKMQGVLQHLGDALSDTADKHDELIVSAASQPVRLPMLCAHPVSFALEVTRCTEACKRPFAFSRAGRFACRCRGSHEQW